MCKTFCGLCKNYQPLPTKQEKYEYPWGGYDIFCIREGMCSFYNYKVIEQQEMNCKKFKEKE